MGAFGRLGLRVADSTFGFGMNWAAQAPSGGCDPKIGLLKHGFLN